MIDTPLEVPTEAQEKTRTSRSSMKLGLYTGLALTLVMFGGLVAANRFPTLEPYALERNAIFAALFLIVALLPVLRYLTSPIQMLCSGIIASVIFACAYDLAGFFFVHLHQVLRTPFEVLIESTVVYGLCAAGAWVTAMVLHAIHHPIERQRRPARETAREIR
jgi:hypothetical protein